MKLNEEQILAELIDNVELLIDYCKLYDQGEIRHAKSIAVTLRTIFHQTEKSESFLKALNILDKSEFLSTAGYIDDESAKKTVQLITLITKVNFPVLNESNQLIGYKPGVVPNFSKGKLTWLDYKKWYESPVFIYNKKPNEDISGLIYVEEVSNKTQFMISRKKLITFFSNKIGGTHIETKFINKEMYNLSRGISSLLYEDLPGNDSREGKTYEEGFLIENILQTALRQIAHETIISIRKITKHRFNYNPSHKNYRVENLKPVNFRLEIIKNNGSKQLVVIDNF